MASDLLTTVRSELDARLRELGPLRAEYERLVAAAEALGATADGAVAAPDATAATPSGSPTRRHRRRRRSPAARAAEPTPAPARRRRPAARERRRAARGAARQAIIAALEHGSHTASELASVTAMTGPNIRVNLRRLLREGTVTRARRDGKSAYALRSASDGD
jgi:DNA-binding transcriptional ArsR family regulator